ncbi:glutamyl-queuosine tRNA(Asp) synthetase [Oleiphilus messinensis]|uniref:Glutamyl-queuosine tRNA(Asp) synthetase n=2 Tax=Oleiphilus messinensis TaxID=141451 RepID=A0A1Y0IGS7_9GAMM|nr:glutamyl-queuosine tRNA(Asp) synthetase [Oleiphilus messinensis]
MGSLVAAVASYLDARAHHGEWLVRIEDIDPLREQPGATDAILESLERHALYWDQPVLYQSKRSEHYEAGLSRLAAAEKLYWCPCSRKMLARHNGRHQYDCPTIFNAAHDTPAPAESALKFNQATTDWTWQDAGCGTQKFHTTTISDDFVVKRKEGYYAYQLAVVIDDIDQEITHIVRGQDLLDSTPMQLSLYDTLSTPPPFYHHTPLVCGQNGQKLSKQNKAPELENTKVRENLRYALEFLGLPVPETMQPCDPETLLSWAATQWLNTLARNTRNR